MRGVTTSVSLSHSSSFISTHTPHARRDNTAPASATVHREFLLTRLMRGVTLSKSDHFIALAFLLTRLMRGVTAVKHFTEKCAKFLLTRLMRGVTLLSDVGGSATIFLLTRLMRGVTQDF